MPLTLGTPYSKNFVGVPPHISKEDYLLWQTYRERLPEGVVNLYFDVGLSGTYDVPQDTTPEMATMWLRLTQKRIDVLMEFENEWIIVELRWNAQSSAVGRLLMYKDLWQKERPDQRPFRLFLVSNSYDPDLKSLCDTVGIQYITIQSKT